MTTSTVNEQQVTEALRLVTTHQLAAASAVQRWMRISFRDATALLDELERRGYVGPAEGSRARNVLARRCEQCGRIGRRGFHTHADHERGIYITVCANKAACRKRWPTPARDDD